VRSGADLECGDSFHTLGEALKAGKITEAEIDRAVFRILKARFELGEMDPEDMVSWNSVSRDLLACDEHDNLALQMARETMTLLQNKGKVLPLSKNAKYAVVGPNAADSLVMWGNYNGIPRKTITVLEGITAKVGAENVVYAKGCELAAASDDAGRYSETEGNYHDEALLKEAAQEYAAMDMSIFDDVDAIIYVGGLSPKLEGEEMRVNYKGFKGGDRTSIELPETQRQYIAELAKTGKPIVFVHLSGSAVALAPEAEICDAILQGWYAGQQGGTAIADVLFGDYNPAGRLPVTFYASDADLPDFGDYDMPGHTYRYFQGKPLFPFGHGLSFSNFKYRRAKVKNDVLRIRVKNASRMDGDEVVQVYIRKADDVDGPIMSLRGFKRVHIKARKRAVVEIPLSAENIDLFNPETGKMEAASGEYIIYYGGTSDISKLRKLRIRI
jgi:beta-glucosidase